MIDLNDFTSEKRCEYKGRIYSVRDNGSVYRHQKDGARLAPLDNKWTFGNKDEKTGYMMIAGLRVHQIVATAFYGAPQYQYMVVDHIDSNKCNNRPENLRWITRLEKALNNPIIRSSIIDLCGSIETFINDPSILGISVLGSNTSWMRTVSKEEAAICSKHLERWAREDNKFIKTINESKWINKDDNSLEADIVHSELYDLYKSQKTKIGENKIVFEKSLKSDFITRENSGQFSQQRANIEDKINDTFTLKDSLTPRAKQLNWKIPTEFPLCPQEFSDLSLQDYLSNLVKNEIFCKNQYYYSEVVKAELSLDGSHIAIITTSNGSKKFALTEIRYENGCFIHESISTYFSEVGVEKYYTLSLGKEWTGGDVLEDFCN